MSHANDPANGHNRDLLPSRNAGPNAEKIADEDVDDIIGIATEIAEQDRQQKSQLDVDDVVQIGEELGLDGHHVERAVDELRDRQQREAEDRAHRQRTRKKYLIVASAGAGVVLAVLLIMGLVGRSSLRDLRAEADQKRAQLRNVVERQHEVNARYANMPSTLERDAEIDGALNRVSIERRRYDEAANRYNAEADSLTGSVATTFFGMPDALPLSGQVVKKLSKEL